MTTSVSYYPTTQSLSLLGTWFGSVSPLLSVLKIGEPPVDINHKVSPIVECNTYSTCFDCRSDSNCHWSVSSRTCSKYEPRLPGRGGKRRKGKGADNDTEEEGKPPKRKTPESCPCEKCKRWATKQHRQGLDWIEKLPQCPCKVDFKKTSTTNNTADQSESQSSSSKLPRDFLVAPEGWSVDPNCNPGKKCGTHPGAFGCFRAPSLDPNSKSGNQCCYDFDGNHISAVDNPQAAGTPDYREATFPYVGHYIHDVVPWQKCCRQCEVSTTCSLYTGSGGGGGVTGSVNNKFHQHHTRGGKWKKQQEPQQPRPGVREDTRACV